MTEKAALRQRMREVCTAIPAAEAADQAARVTEAIAQWDVYRRAECVMLYVPLSYELDTSALLDRVLADGKRLVLPRCEELWSMQAVQANDWRELVPGRLGLREPPREWPTIDPTEIDLILIPGWAFDASGGRLGKGAGYYDRFLPRTGATTAGVAYLEQIIERVPMAAHDHRIQFLASARGVLPTDDKGDGRL